MASFDNLQSDPLVTMRRFGQIMGWFGPFDEEGAFLTEMAAVVSQPWFHGDLSPEHGSSRLLQQRTALLPPFLLLIL